MKRLRDKLRGLVDPVPSKRKTHPVRTGLILIALSTLLTFAAVTHTFPLPKGGEVVRAEFTNASQVFNNNGATFVRVAGVDVGKVQSVDPGHTRGTAIVTMQVNDDHFVVKRDARAQVRWRTILGGQMYIDLHPGSSSAPPLGDGLIPASHTSHQQELDDLLQIYSGGTDQAQRGLIKGFAKGFSDPASARRAIDRVSPALRSVDRGTEPALGEEPHDLRKLVAATGRTVDALGRDRAALQGLVVEGDRTLAVTDARRRELGETLALSPATLDSTFTTMRRLRTTLDHLDPLVERLRPGARELAPAATAARPTLSETQGFLADARPLLRSARPTFVSLRGASDEGVPLLLGLDPTLRRLDAELLPYLRRRDDRTRLPLYEAIGPTFSVLDYTAAEFDRIGYRSRFTVPLSINSLSGPSTRRPGPRPGGKRP